MRRTTLESQLESILFFAGDVVQISRLCELCEVKTDDIIQAMYRLNNIYEQDESGLRILEVADGYQMCTDPKNMQIILKYKNRPAKKFLTQTYLETLAIIAYNQPITRVQIEDIRGVRTDRAISKLLDYNLIQEVGRLNVIGRPMLLGTTNEFLKHFGFKSIAELPQVEEELIEKFRQEIEVGIQY